MICLVIKSQIGEVSPTSSINVRTQEEIYDEVDNRQKSQREGEIHDTMKWFNCDSSIAKEGLFWRSNYSDCARLVDPPF